jgi:hypothetical protein
MTANRLRSKLLECGLIVAVVTLSGCQQEAKRPPAAARSPSQANAIENLEIRSLDSGISVHYRTSTTVRSCEAQAAEMPRVWVLAVKKRLEADPIQRVVLFPEDNTGQSVSIEFTKGADGQWSSIAPCVIRIPSD